MTKIFMIAFFLATFVFISSCSFFTGSRSTASVENQCVTLAPSSGLNIQNICAGERSYILKTKTSGKIKEIDISGMENDKAESIFFLVEDKAGHKVRITGNEVVLNKKGLCLKTKDKKQLCVSDRFNSLIDGNDRVILGFSLSTFAEQDVFIYSKGISDNLIRKESTLDVASSVVATRNGLITKSATCNESKNLKDENGLIKCAKKELIKKLDKGCDIFRHGSGRVLADIETKNIKVECTGHKPMFGSSKNSCSAELEAKCEKTKSSDGLVVVQPATNAVVDDSLDDDSL